ncbi:MAG: colanic acid biosynthesis acetyltransferase WcaF [Alcaligenaceae bacterium]|jgi:putative colanic acid biosynthesis acetyltransferase WcaF|nr:colanic acid biosynthesis acetyltransferase WcaF [Alcaligenaceae bacterium]
MKLKSFRNQEFDRGVSKLVELAWVVSQSVLFDSFLPGSWWRAKLLTWFGARVGRGVVIKPGVRIKFPWKLTIGDDCWIGEGVWIDNLDFVVLFEDTCISQGVYLCTGSHDWSKESFDLITKPIVIGPCAWVGAFCKVAPGVQIAFGSVCVMGSVVTRSTGEWEIWGGHPFEKIKSRPR